MLIQVFWPATGDTAVHPTPCSFHQHGDTGCLAGHRWYCSSPYTIQLPSTWWHRFSGRPQVKLQFTLHHTASIHMVTQVVWPATGDTALHPTPYSFHQHCDTGCLAGHRWYCTSPYTIQLPSTWWHSMSGRPQVILQFTLHHTASVNMVTHVVMPATGDTALHPTPYSFHQHGDTICLAGHRWYCSSIFTIQLPSTWWHRWSGRPQVILQFTLHHTASINMVTQVFWPATGDTAVHSSPYSFHQHGDTGFWRATGNTAPHPTPYSFHQYGDTGFLAGHRWYCSSPYTIQLPSTWWYSFSGRPQVILQVTLHHTASINIMTQVVWPDTSDTAVHTTPYSFHQHGDTGFLAGHRWYCSSPYTIQLPSTWWYRFSGRP